ncbi:MAG: antibiotic biosynthesis monooxygenase [Bacteroidetes bacterium]|nr:MAG: antibiotic biosynthesis monooxygenase [Bacteroidota bacterium]
MKAKLLVMLFCAAVVYSSCGGKKSGGSLQVADNQAKASAPEYKMMIIAKLAVKPEKVKVFIDAAREMIEKSNKEGGCSFYQLYQDPYDNSKFVFVEEYKNQAAVDNHFASEYFKGFGPKISDLVAGPAEIKVISVAKEVIQ